MSDSKLHLMSFAPVPDTKTTVHVVGLPDSLRDALFTLMPPRKEGGYLNTKVLKDDLRCWLDRAVELNPVRPNVHTDSWLIALAPIDLAKLCNVIAVWISSRKDIDTSIPAIGLKVYNSGNGKARASFPYCVRQDMRSGAVTVYCPLLPDGSLPYWRALIEFARLSGSEGFPDSCKRANGMALKRMLHGIVRATGDRPELLLVNSYGRIRQRDWWPGISDSGLESGPLSYGPTGYEEPLGLAGSKLRILRIRSGLNGEVPDWFTDEVAAGGADDGTVPNRRDKQGLFKMDGYFLALAPRPGDAQYKWSARGSKYDSPTAAFCEKTINEYCLLSPGGEAEALASVKYAEALRGCMVQLYKNDMRVNLPAPLHLAEQVEEYIWDWGLTGRR